MRIDTVTLRDLDEIYNLERKSFKKDAFSKDLVLNLIIQNTFFLKLIDTEISNKIVGFIIIIEDREDRLNLINLLIKKNYQKKGYGTYLLSYVVKKVRELHNVKSIVLNVNSKNEVAIKLYQKFNFQIVKRIENYYRQKESAYLMILNI
jgi:ribosomal-protein-alanine N-acetyltransferase